MGSGSIGTLREFAATMAVEDTGLIFEGGAKYEEASRFYRLAYQGRLDFVRHRVLDSGKDFAGWLPPRGKTAPSSDEAGLMLVPGIADCGGSFGLRLLVVDREFTVVGESHICVARSNDIAELKYNLFTHHIHNDKVHHCYGKGHDETVNLVHTGSVHAFGGDMPVDGLMMMQVVGTPFRLGRVKLHLMPREGEKALLPIYPMTLGKVTSTLIDASWLHRRLECTDTGCRHREGCSHARPHCVCSPSHDRFSLHSWELPWCMRGDNTRNPRCEPVSGRPIRTTVNG